MDDSTLRYSTLSSLCLLHALAAESNLCTAKSWALFCMACYVNEGAASGTLADIFSAWRNSGLRCHVASPHRILLCRMTWRNKGLPSGPTGGLPRKATVESSQFVDSAGVGNATDDPDGKNERKRGAPLKLPPADDLVASGGCRSEGASPELPRTSISLFNREMELWGTELPQNKKKGSPYQSSLATHSLFVGAPPPVTSLQARSSEGLDPSVNLASRKCHEGELHRNSPMVLSLCPTTTTSTHNKVVG
ncbi:hypothetical protein CRG98_033968 [Punica granatum]|uniref:Uncharacterized protein n=1 Tax=Punica granatum TaxID=22663 RepID=A0A2I0INR6_PUNGR|nr:hypothetical protein CRG98_033968 [Punica granatum]